MELWPCPRKVRAILFTSVCLWSFWNRLSLSYLPYPGRRTTSPIFRISFDDDTFACSEFRQYDIADASNSYESCCGENGDNSFTNKVEVSNLDLVPNESESSCSTMIETVLVQENSQHRQLTYGVIDDNAIESTRTSGISIEVAWWLLWYIGAVGRGMAEFSTFCIHQVISIIYSVFNDSSTNDSFDVISDSLIAVDASSPSHCAPLAATVTTLQSVSSTDDLDTCAKVV